eukprot:3315668-Alexandrium_andersonii.AAC.1
MCIRDSLSHDVSWVALARPLDEVKVARAAPRPSAAPVRYRTGGKCPVSYTHLTLPTICSV